MHAGWRSRGYIPHCDGAGVVQHVVMSTIGAGGGIEANFGQRFFETPDTLLKPRGKQRRR
jgi:hypothetical protein